MPAQPLSHAWLILTLWTETRRAPRGFPRQECWGGVAISFLQGVFPTRDETHVPCIGRYSSPLEPPGKLALACSHHSSAVCRRHDPGLAVQLERRKIAVTLEVRRIFCLQYFIHLSNKNVLKAYEKPRPILDVVRKKNYSWHLLKMQEDRFHQSETVGIGWGPIIGSCSGEEKGSQLWTQPGLWEFIAKKRDGGQ